MTNTAWREKDAEWKGQMNVIVRELDKNQSELEHWVNSLQKNYNKLATEIAILNTHVNQNRGRWNRILDIAAAIIASTAVFIICYRIFQ